MKLKLNIFHGTLSKKVERNLSFGFDCCYAKCSFAEEEEITQILEKIPTVLMCGAGFIVLRGQCAKQNKHTKEPRN